APKYQRPANPAPASFPTGPAYPPAPSADVAPVGWQDFFSDPKLKRVIAEALASNRDLRIAVANIEAARAQYHVQRAALFPTLTANATATYGQEPVSVVSGGAISPGHASVFNERLYSLTAGVSNWQLDFFGKVRNLTKDAQEQYFASQEARDEAQLVLVDEVATDYLTFAADRSLLVIAQETLTSSQDSLDLTQARFNAGVASALDAELAKTLVDQSRFAVARLTTQVAQDRNALELVVGAPVSDTDLPPAQGAEVVVMDRLPAAVSSTALLKRPDVLQAEHVLRGANANIGAARANFFPDISLTGNGGLTSLALSSLFKGASATWSFIPSVSQTIFDFGANKGNLAFAKAQRDLDVAQYEKAVQTAFREVADALAERGTIDEQVAAQEALTEASRNSFDLSTARYQKGADTFLNVLIAQRTFYVAQQTLVTTRLARSLNLVTLYGVLGGGLDAPQEATKGG
ncbi:MAG TPA: efflux transporter outer membrane subunit, partial [Caulobacteraceae bacterium]